MAPSGYAAVPASGDDDAAGPKGPRVPRFAARNCDISPVACFSFLPEDIHPPMTRILPKFLFALLLAGGALAGSPAHAATVQMDYSFEFSGGTPPSGPAPWMRSVFTDEGSAVRLTVSTAGLQANENAIGVYFNLDPSLDLSRLGAAFASASGLPQASIAYAQSVNAFKADGDGLYDILFSFPTGNGAGTFGPGQSFDYLFTYSGAGTFNAGSFAFLSQPAGGHGPYYSAAHVQDTGAGLGSGWIAPSGLSLTGDPAPVPLPAGAPFLLGGLAFFWRVGRRRGA